MIDRNVFNSLYNEKFLTNQKESFSITEKDKGAFVKGATFMLSGGDFDFCGEVIWDKAVELYTTHSQEFYFRKKCDGFAFCKVENRHYLIWVEIKSSVHELFNKAIFQLSSCYVKMKSYLNVFSIYNPNDFEELAIVVCPPEETHRYEETDNSSVLNRRQSLVCQNATPIDKCRRRYRRTGKLILKGDDFGVDKLCLRPEVKLNELRVYTYFTNEQNPTIDLAQVIRNVLEHEP